jgi:hypothetical protein
LEVELLDYYKFRVEKCCSLSQSGAARIRAERLFLKKDIYVLATSSPVVDTQENLPPRHTVDIQEIKKPIDVVIENNIGQWKSKWNNNDKLLPFKFILPYKCIN